MGVFPGLHLVLVFICTLTAGVSAQDSEPQCYSRFDYEYKVLQRLIQLEESHKGLIEKLNDRERENSELRSQIKQLNETVEVMEKSGVVNPGEAHSKILQFKTSIIMRIIIVLKYTLMLFSKDHRIMFPPTH